MLSKNIKNFSKLYVSVCIYSSFANPFMLMKIVNNQQQFSAYVLLYANGGKYENKQNHRKRTNINKNVS